MDQPAFLREHQELTRRYFLKLGVLGTAVGAMSPTTVFAQEAAPPKPRQKPDKAGAMAESYFTPTADFRDVSRGKPIPHTLDEAKRREVGLTRETWRLEVIPDPDSPTKLRKPLTGDAALTFDQLMELAKEHAVRFPKIMTCLNLGCPLGMGLWEGVPLREVVWLTKPTENLRRIFYYGFHNDDPKQMFRSSLPIGRILEDPPGLPPVILCYKLNGEWLDPERGGPVRVVVPEHYGFKSVKWLTHVVLTNLPHANDTYAEQNNDVDSPLKTFAAVLSYPTGVKAGEAIPVSGYAQVGVSGLSKVQVSIERNSDRPEGDPDFLKAPWVDAELLAAPREWGALEGGKVPSGSLGFDDSGKPKTWPMKLAKAHWAAVLPSLPAGEYTLRSRTIDENGQAQPRPRPFRKSGHATIESIVIKVADSM